MSKRKTNQPDEYGSSAIQVLDDVAHIRLRPGTFIGPTDSSGLFIILKEILDNALDEALAGHAKNITLRLDDDCRGATVSDDGRGIPLEKQAQSGLSALATVFAMTKAGAKFNNKMYGTSVGLNGLGSTATNALSETFEAWSHRGRQSGHVKFLRGRICGRDADVQKNTSGIKHGTVVHFRPDFAEIFRDVPAYDPADIKSRLEDVAKLLPDTNIFFQNGSADEPVRLGGGGMPALLAKYSDNAELSIPAYSGTVTFPVALQNQSGEGQERDAELQFCFAWRRDQETVIRSYTNLSHNAEGGVHQSAFEKSLIGFLLERARGKCTAKEISEGLVCLLHIKHPCPQFGSQTKEKLVNRELTKQVPDALEPALKRWARTNAQKIDEFLSGCIELYNRRLAEKELKGALKDLKVTRRSSRGILPAKLFEADCQPNVRELYLVEGDSAAGSAVRGRDAGYQEVLPLKGKILNAFKASEAEVVSNEEVSAIIAAVGGGFGQKFSISNVRVNKIILLSDADHDGFHISSLVLGLLAKYMPQLIERGMVYTVDSPLFKASLPGSKKRWFGHTINDLKARAGKDFSKCEITRLKGHGEANYDQVAEYAMRPDTRKLIQMTWVDADFKAIEHIMGDDVIGRKELLGIEDSE